ncbi:cation:dicarboxylase symporter family transporter [Escherichia coli]|nr:cation:dicarboxylase symporter family transporter [Escherichia coli]EFB4396752.1 cation:dicarboxylase symporter family transporter [Escherichia coli]EFE0722172.1 cation:dicarboxylase symporter family transporter [Escherichia coli]EFE0726250.1 cation:dicarboxylase symporter family transporter [Escherichia coli]EFE0773106.1 cation:dicarboxylase symporter family transporter [Escherichia coli]
MKSIKFSLAWQILFAMVLGILLGSYLHYHSDSRDWLVVNLLSPAGDIFIHLIKMIVVPIVISTLVVGIAGVGDAKQLGRIGAKTIIYFEVITTVAIILGITLANVFQPGAGVDMSQLATVDISKYQSTTEAVQSSSHGIMGTILSLVPGVSFVVLLATLGSVGIPLEGLAFIAGVDRILDMARTALNVVGNALAVLVIAKWEHKFDRKKALAYEREVLGKFDKTADQ